MHKSLEIEDMPPLAFECKFTGFEGYYKNFSLIPFFLRAYKYRSCEVKVIEKITDIKGYGTITVLDSGENLKKSMIDFGFY